VIARLKVKRYLQNYSFYFQFFSRDRVALVGSFGAVLFLAWAGLEGLLQVVGWLTKNSEYGIMLLGADPLANNFSWSLTPPSVGRAGFLLGTDFNGRSILLRILYAAPSDAAAAMLVVLSGIVIGMLIGTSAAYLGGWVEEIFMRLTDAFLTVPAVLLAIVIGILLGNGFSSVLVALVVVWWPTYSRFFRGQTLPLKSRAFVSAAKLGGIGSLKIIVKHIIPNSLDPVLAYATLDLGNVILTYSSLSFLGIGAQSPFPEWGAMSFGGLSYFPQYWWISIFPGLVILLVATSFTVVGDRLQDFISGKVA